MRWLVVGVVVAVVLAGCTGGTDTPSMMEQVQNDPGVSWFLEQHPNASAERTRWPSTKFQDDSGQITQHCRDALNTSQTYYRITFQADNEVMIVWTTADDHTIHCQNTRTPSRRLEDDTNATDLIATNDTSKERDNVSRGDNILTGDSITVTSNSSQSIISCSEGVNIYDAVYDNKTEEVVATLENTGTRDLEKVKITAHISSQISTSNVTSITSNTIKNVQFSVPEDPQWVTASFPCPDGENYLKFCRIKCHHGNIR